MRIFDHILSSSDNLFKDILCMNKEISKSSFSKIMKNWPIMFIGTGYGIVVMLLSTLLMNVFRGPLSIVSGFLMAFIMASIYSHYLYLLHQIIKTGRINSYDFRDGFRAYLQKIYGIFFLMWIASFLLNAVRMPALTIIVYYGAVLVFNALPESIYLKHYDSMDTVRYSLDFIKENWVEWYVPNAVFLVAMLFLNIKMIVNPYALLLARDLNQILLFVLGQLLFNYIMIYRGLLFELLSTSTRRKREFMRNCK